MDDIATHPISLDDDDDEQVGGRNDVVAGGGDLFSPIDAGNGGGDSGVTTNTNGVKDSVNLDFEEDEKPFQVRKRYFLF